MRDGDEYTVPEHIERFNNQYKNIDNCAVIDFYEDKMEKSARSENCK